MSTEIQLKSFSAADWTSNQGLLGNVPILVKGEAGYESDTGKFKIGDGTSIWSALAYFQSGAYISSTLMTTLGDTIYGGASGASTRLAGPATNGTYVLTSVPSASVAVAPAWALASGLTVSSATTATKSTNLVGGNTTTLLGSIPYQSAVDTTTLLSPNTTITKKFLRQTGTGTNGAAPAWDTLIAGDIPDLSATYLPLSGGSISGQLTSTYTGTWNNPNIILQGTEPNIKFQESAQPDAQIGINNGNFYVLGDTASDGTYDTVPFYFNLTTGNTVLLGDLEINGADITTTSTGTATLFNTNATTLNLGGGATTAVNIGSASGVTNFASTIDLRAGGTAANTAPLYFSASTDLLSTPVAGAVEYNNANFLATPFTTSGRALIESNYFYSNQAAVTIAGTSTGLASISGNVFGVALPLATSTAYQIEATLYLQTSYTINAPSAQSMTLTAPTGSTVMLEGSIVQNVAAVTTQSTASSFYAMILATNRTLTAVTASGNWHRINMRGIIRTSTNAGSFSVVLGGTNGAAPATLTLTLGADSFIKLTPIGSATSSNSFGAWA